MVWWSQGSIPGEWKQKPYHSMYPKLWSLQSIIFATFYWVKQIAKPAQTQEVWKEGPPRRRCKESVAIFTTESCAIFLDGSPNIIKMTVPPNKSAWCHINQKSQQLISGKLVKLFLNFIWKSKELRITNPILRKDRSSQISRLTIKLFEQ